MWWIFFDEERGGMLCGYNDDEMNVYERIFKLTTTTSRKKGGEREQQKQESIIDRKQS